MRILLIILLFLTYNVKSQSLDSKINNFIVEWKNVPYKFGGNTKKGIDCSGFSQKFYKEIYDLEIPRTCYYQQLYSIKINLDSIKIGDIIFFTSTTSPSKRHCGIYLGDGTFIHAANHKYGIKISCLYDNDYMKRIIGVGRFTNSLSP